MTANARKGNTGEAETPLLARCLPPTATLPPKSVSINLEKAVVNERVVVHIFVQPSLTSTGTYPVEFDVTVFKNETLQSLHDDLSKKKNLNFKESASYVVSTKMNDDLDVLKTFNDFGLIKDSTLVVRFKLILVMFLLEGFTNIETNTLITEPLSVTLRLDTIFGKATNNMALHVGKTSDTLDYFFDGKNLETSKGLTLLQIGISNAPVIIVKLKKERLLRCCLFIYFLLYKFCCCRTRKNRCACLKL